MLIEDTTRLGVPANPLLVADAPDLFSTLARIRLGVVVVLIALLGVVLVRRWDRATPSQRRALTPVYLSGGLVLALYAVWAVLGVANVAPGTQETLERARVIALAVVPFAFLAGLLRSRVAGAVAVSELVARLGAGRRRSELRDALADALGDRSLQVAYWLPERQEWVDAAGASFALPGEGSGRMCTPVEQDGEPVAMLIHDPSVAEERERVRAVGGAAALALENERLDAELRANVQELRASRVRIVESARRRAAPHRARPARRRAAAAGRARDRRCGPPARAWSATRGAAGELLDAAARDLEAAIRDLRELARGIHPAVLSDRGLAAALEALAGRIPLPVEIASVPEGRLPESVEAAVYFVVAEAITNVARYARASHARVSVARDGQRVVVEVADDGVGGADAAKGSGLRGLVDRVAALDGRFDVESPPGGGTTVRAVIPLPPAAAGSAAQPSARFASRGVRREAETSGT